MGYWDRIVPSQTPSSYERDFTGWAFEQARLVRSMRPNGIDVENIAEELEDLGKAQYNKLESLLAIVLLHLVKWDHQPSRRSRGWQLSVRSCRKQAAKHYAKNPSLKPLLDDIIEDAYLRARHDALQQTGLSDTAIAETCPYDWDAIMHRELKLDDPE